MWVSTTQLERGRERERKRHALPEGGGAMTWSHASIDAHVRGLFSWLPRKLLFTIIKKQMFNVQKDKKKSYVYMFYKKMWIDPTKLKIYVYMFYKLVVLWKERSRVVRRGRVSFFVVARSKRDTDSCSHVLSSQSPSLYMLRSCTFDD